MSKELDAAMKRTFDAMWRHYYAEGADAEDSALDEWVNAWNEAENEASICGELAKLNAANLDPSDVVLHRQKKDPVGAK